MKWWLQLEIRSITPEDAELFLALSKRLDQETAFMLYEPNERKTTALEQKNMIERIISAKNSTILVAEHIDKIVGFIALFGNKNLRNKHSAYIVIGILQDYTGKGLGTKLFEQGILWAKAQNFHRLELTVMVHNKSGIALYEKMGFQREGIKKHSLKVNGQWVDEYYYSYLMEE
ncbi:GNAT family N-acetyltransferase [Bacillus suaedaesalsae]|uniref:GNAT family N-acetyltransferase n=1 Tax=Bacillus suaedaesalsae TaxID=2810349 RepID=A0ABS2DLF9_9BACI|nr:GNAT family protein [Bacillus suaedaesalsae]MBM6619329.1 GNAT family N-acetyltransferase [Bacillus suaedaesalsae]